MNDDVLVRIQRLEWQNRVLMVLLCAAVVIACIGAARAKPGVAGEIRAHRFSVVDPAGKVVSSWYSDEAESWYGPR